MKDTTPQAVQACHELLLWLIPQLDKFPRTRRYEHGARLMDDLGRQIGGWLRSDYRRGTG